jgi:hypothetical protein
MNGLHQHTTRQPKGLLLALALGLAWSVYLPAHSAPALAAEPATAAPEPAPRSATQATDVERRLFEDVGSELFRDTPPRQGPPAGSPPASSDPPSRPPLAQHGAGEDVGGDVLHVIAQRMRQVQELLSRAQTGEPTQQMQQQIVEDLRRLLQQQAAQQPAQAAAAQPSAGQPMEPSDAAAASDGQGDGPSRSDPSDSSQRVEQSDSERVDMAAVADIMQRLWGHLPQRWRAPLLQRGDVRFLPQYELLIEEYFKMLAEQPPDGS